MLTIDQLTAKGQEALRERLLRLLTGSTKEEALLKEHYDSLHDLTHISKKTLKRFFKDKVQVGPQTRNLLAAIALGRKEELLSLSEPQQDYYLTFLETLSTDWLKNEPKPDAKTPSADISAYLSRYYRAGAKVPGSLFDIKDKHLAYAPLLCCRRPWRETRIKERQHQEVVLEKSILFSRNRPILIGEAGMGKTSFANQICFNWADKESPSEPIPIYIDLRHEHYNRERHGIIGFLLTRYFGSKNDWMVMDFLEREPQSYYLLLDGYDDLSPLEKESLFKELNAICTEMSYAILSRPYGLNDYQLPDQLIYEIAGLDLPGQEQMIRQFIPETNSSLKVSSFMAFIHGQPVLSALSRSPLCLIYMIKLVMARENSFSQLEGIRSGLDLQHTYNRLGL